MKKKIYVLNGPNLNFLGLREPEIYGRDTMLDIEELCRKITEDNFFLLFFRQSNHEGVLVDHIQSACEKSAAAIVINPAAYSHTSIAILDALKSFNGPVAEVHLSNIHKRESFRHHSYVSFYADCVIAGCGILGYRFALEFVMEKYRKT